METKPHAVPKYVVYSFMKDINYATVFVLSIIAVAADLMLSAMK